jgi:hypothetical protein
MAFSFLRNRHGQAKERSTDCNPNSSGLLKNARGRILAEKWSVTCAKQLDGGCD